MKPTIVGIAYIHDSIGKRYKGTSGRSQVNMLWIGTILVNGRLIDTALEMEADRYSYLNLQ